MPKINSKKVKISNIITFVILILLLYFAYQFYQTNNFNDFVRSESNLHLSEFKRDKKVKYSEAKSYKIDSPEYNDAMFFKTIKVKKNTPYKVTCMVKTDKVLSENGNSNIGAQIGITDTTERSIAIQNTQDWQKIELIFNSKNREEVEIAFRLGGINGKARGTAWFSDFSIEEGYSNSDNDWNFACFIFTNTNVEIDNNIVDINMTDEDISDIKDTIKRFETSCNILSEQKMDANCDIYLENEPITKLSYDEEFGYYVAAEDVENQIKSIIDTNDYDHIFVIIRLGDDEHQTDIEVKDWIGLGAMDYYGIGYSNIRLPNSSKSYTYKYNQSINQFPEEVFLHEFLHSLERTAKEYGYTIPALHDYEKYGYENERVIGQKKWYTDYMNQNIQTQNGKTGLPEEIYKMKPANNFDFEDSYKLDEFKEPENIIEEIRQIFKNLVRNINYVKNSL